MEKRESSFDISEAKAAPSLEDATSAADLSKSVVVIVRGNPVNIRFDMGEVTPRLRRKLESLGEDVTDDAASDVVVDFLSAIVVDWDLTNKRGETVPVGDIEDVPYRDLITIMEGVNSYAAPNASGGQGSPALSSSSQAENSPSASAEG